MATDRFVRFYVFCFVNDSLGAGKNQDPGSSGIRIRGPWDPSMPGSSGPCFLWFCEPTLARIAFLLQQTKTCVPEMHWHGEKDRIRMQSLTNPKRCAQTICPVVYPIASMSCTPHDTPIKCHLPCLMHAFRQ